jgi:hypothetical protein
METTRLLQPPAQGVLAVWFTAREVSGWDKGEGSVSFHVAALATPQLTCLFLLLIENDKEKKKKATSV